jgi:hypothetical protein
VKSLRFETTPQRPDARGQEEGLTSLRERFGGGGSGGSGGGKNNRASGGRSLGSGRQHNTNAAQAAGGGSGGGESALHGARQLATDWGSGGGLSLNSGRQLSAEWVSGGGRSGGRGGARSLSAQEQESDAAIDAAIDDVLGGPLSSDGGGGTFTNGGRGSSVDSRSGDVLSLDGRSQRSTAQPTSGGSGYDVASMMMPNEIFEEEETRIMVSSGYPLDSQASGGILLDGRASSGIPLDSPSSGGIPLDSTLHTSVRGGGGRGQHGGIGNGNAEEHDTNDADDVVTEQARTSLIWEGSTTFISTVVWRNFVM